MTKHITTSILFFVALLLCAQGLSASLRDSVSQTIAKQLAVYPQEKIYLHTDRDYYIPGERIWCKAYVADAATHQPIDASRYVYVELVSESGTIAYQTTLRCVDGMYHGNIFLSDVVPAGYYMLRAYTRYMGNPEEDYFFRKQIRIGRLTADNDQESEKDKQTKKRSVSKANYAVSFFPEGGNLVPGSLCRVAFKAINNSGYGEEVRGEIVDGNGLIITTASTTFAGMGNFAFIPEARKRYSFRASNSKGMARQFELPDAQSGAVALSVYLHNGRLSVARTGVSEHGNQPKQYLLIHCRGQVLHASAWNNQDPYYAFSTDQLPAGVIQCLLFDEALNPLSERLVFNRGAGGTSFAFTTDKNSYQTREKVSAGLRITDKQGRPFKGNLSVAITDDRDIQPDASNTILSSLLLTSELKGYIESPGYYFESVDPEKELALDNLMMTQGWRRYDIPAVMKGNVAQPKQFFETDKRITGIVKSGILSKPVKDGEVTLMAIEEGLLIPTKTDSTGRFAFEYFEYADTFQFTLQARNRKNSDNVFIEVDPEMSQPARSQVLLPAQRQMQLPIFPDMAGEVAVDADPFLTKAKERSKYDEEMRLIQLREVEVVARRPKKTQIYSQYSGFARTTIDKEWIEKHKPHSTEMLFRSIPHLLALGNDYINAIGSGNGPMIMIDGLQMTVQDRNNSPMQMESGGEKDKKPKDKKSIMSVFDIVRIQDIKAVEFFTGPETAIFGTRGFGGVINIVTMSFEEKSKVVEESPNVVALTRVGYQSPVEFYAPVYETEEQKFNILPDLRTTIWWKPDLVTDDNGEASFDFYTSDYTTSYTVVIEGLGDDGTIIRQTEKIQIR